MSRVHRFLFEFTALTTGGKRGDGESDPAVFRLEGAPGGFVPHQIGGGFEGQGQAVAPTGEAGCIENRRVCGGSLAQDGADHLKPGLGT